MRDHHQCRALLCGKPQQKLGNLLARMAVKTGRRLVSDDDAGTLQQRLRDIAQWNWLAHVANIAPKIELEGFSVILEISELGRVVRNERLQAPSAYKPLRANEQAHLLVRNASGQSVDLLIAELDNRGMLHTVYPESSRESNRFERGTRQAPAVKRFPISASSVKSGGQVVVIAGLAQPQSPPRLFGLNLSETSGDVQIRGQLIPSKDRQVFASMLRWRDNAVAEK